MNYPVLVIIDSINELIKVCVIDCRFIFKNSFYRQLATLSIQFSVTCKWIFLIYTDCRLSFLMVFHGIAMLTMTSVFGQLIWPWTAFWINWIVWRNVSVSLWKGIAGCLSSMLKFIVLAENSNSIFTEAQPILISLFIIYQIIRTQ